MILKTYVNKKQLDSEVLQKKTFVYILKFQYGSVLAKDHQYYKDNIQYLLV